MKMLILFWAVLSMIRAANDATLIGGVTFYTGERWHGSPLACDYKLSGPQVYARETGPWVAVDDDYLSRPDVHCGDFVIVVTVDGQRKSGRVLDTGYLGEARVYDTGLPFITDMPSYWRNGAKTGTGRMMNVSFFLREIGSLTTEEMACEPCLEAQ